MAEFLPVVVTTVYFCFMPVQEKAKRKVNELESVQPNRQCQDVFPSLASPLPPPSAQVICLKSSLISTQVSCKEEEVRQPESYGLCADFQVRLKLAPQGFRGAYLVGKEGFFSKYKESNVYQGGSPQRNLGGRNAVPVECASLFSLQNVDTS